MANPDPGRVVLRRACRVGVVLPAAFALSLLLLQDSSAALYAAFGSFTLLAFADFGGPLPRRFVAYLVAGAVGMVGIVLGTVVAPLPWLAALTAAGVGFTVALASVLRGYVAASAAPVQLAFVLAATSGSALDALPGRLVAWGLATVLAAVSALLLWPLVERSVLRRRAGEMLLVSADLVDARWPADGSVPDEAVVATADAALVRAHERVREAFRGRPTRPGGTTLRDRAVLELVDELSRLRSFARWRPGGGAAGAPDDLTLADRTSTSLREAGRALAEGGPPPDPALLSRQREEHRLATSGWAAAALPVVGAQVVRERLDAGFVLRVLSLAATFVAADTRGAVGAAAETDAVTTAGAPLPEVPWTISAWAMVRAQLSPRSPWWRNAVRSGLGIGIAVLVALLMGADHAFWVVLGTLSALRFDALGTGRTAAQAVAGTAVGVLLGSGVLLLVGDRTGVLWPLLALGAFLAAYTPTAVSFLMGQAAFSGFVLVLFALASGLTLSTGLVRLVDIAIGVAVSAALGLLLWPRGVLVQVRGTLADALDAAGEHLRTCVGALLGAVDPEQVEVTRRHAAAAVARANEAFDLALMQRMPNRLHLRAWATLAAAGGHTVQVADLVDFLRRAGVAGRPTRPGAGPTTSAELLAGTPALPALASAAGAVNSRLDVTAARLRALDDTTVARADDVDQPLRVPTDADLDPQVVAMHTAVTSTLVGWAGRHDDALGSDVLLAVWAADQLAHLDYLAVSAGVAVDSLAGATAVVGTAHRD